MFETVVCADIGSAYTKLYCRGAAVCDESRAALDPNNESCVLGIGGKSRQLLNTCAVYPVRGGAVANTMLAAIMLRRMTLDMLNRKTLLGVSLKLLLPKSLGSMQALAACDTAKAAGFHRVRTADLLLCAADGAGLDISSPCAVMIADIGRDKLAAAVCANGGTVCQSLRRFGSADFEKTLRAWFASEHGLLVGSRAAELVKKSLHLPNIPVCGRAASSGEPVSRTLRSSEIRAALKPVYDALASELTEALNTVPPDAAADICDRGIMLTGGGAEQFGICGELEARLGVPVRAAANAGLAAVYGAGEGPRREGRAQKRAAAMLAG